MQLISSDRSLQSLSLSQTQLFSIHRPFAHSNLSEVQLATTPVSKQISYSPNIIQQLDHLPQLVSSEKSSQSSSPSHIHAFRIHLPVLGHLTIMGDSSHFRILSLIISSQSISSSPSWQSLSPSHLKESTITTTCSCS